MKNKTVAMFAVVVAGGIIWQQYRVQKLEKRAAVVESQANANMEMSNRALMMVQNFYDHAPQEIVNIINAMRCNCGQDNRPMITTRPAGD